MKLAALAFVLAASTICSGATAESAGEPEARAAATVDAVTAVASAPPKRRYVVAAIGDSLTDTRVGGGRYLHQLGRACPQSRFDAFGVGGQRTDHMRWRLLADVFGIGAAPGTPKRPRYTHLIVLGGVNDLSSMSPSHAPTRRVMRNLEWMYSAARSRGVEVIAVTLPPWLDRSSVRDARARATRELNHWIQAEAREGRVAYGVDIHDALRCSDGLLCSEYRRFPGDSVHWGAAGHRVVADALLREAFSDCR